MSQFPEDDARRRAARGRQVIAGSDIRPPAYQSRSVAYEDEGLLSRPQWIYLAMLAALLAIGILLYLAIGGGAASVIFFLLALGLFAGWLVF